MKKYYIVTYQGMYLGGQAVVMAKSAEEAIELVRCDSGTLKFNNPTAEEIKPKNGVLFNWVGDY